ncbi:chemotaxis response regulator protein-glutamate methylesterase [Niveibacterium sp. SC-1]|uniref:protein-glutamate methylesterase/protein-glutamine glutaminase n=1 Tax=Niveibacterium sp. SC-1 TaxID=3135646 RepID=UPI0031201D05
MIKVLVVDDSAVMRNLLTELINEPRAIRVVGSAANAAEAERMIDRLHPDVLTLDVEMPGTDGLQLLERVMHTRPLPVVMISGLTERGSDITFRALELGAVDFVAKPRRDPINGLRPYAEEIREKIRTAHAARLIAPERFVAGGAPAPALPTALDPAVLREGLVLIGASTGGTEAIKDVLTALPEEMPGIVMVQHMPEMFTASFARRLDSLCNMRVKEAEQGERILPGHAYLAPGHSHLAVRRGPAGYVCELQRSEPVNRHRPSVDVLFHSGAQVVGPRGLGVILTGMGKDGAQGMLAMHRSGMWTIGQDKESCVVYGMPREAAEIGAVDEVVPLGQIGQRILARLRQPARRIH